MDGWTSYEQPDLYVWPCSACQAAQYLTTETPLDSKWHCPHCEIYEEDKTIKSLEESIRDLKPFCENQECRKKAMKVYAALESLYATLDLLKEQKGVAKCRNCGVLLHEQCEYCPNCGKLVKWE